MSRPNPAAPAPPARGRRWIRRACLGSTVFLALAATTACALFRGPAVAPTPLPSARLVDLHVHAAGIGAGGSGCRISPALQSSYKYDIYLRAFGTSRAEVLQEGDAVILRRISEQVSASRDVGHAVVLAIDGAFDPATGDLDPVRTEVYVPDAYLAREAARHTNLLWGASIHPLRPDAVARLDWAADHGAVLVKWIPSIQHFAPDDPRCIPFYRRLVALQMPLLCHAGQERSFTRAEDALCDPTRLRLPLELGVTVIAAHVASTGSNEGERDIERLVRLMREFPNLRSEVSSLTQLNKPGYLREALLRPEFRGRLAYGSDFPLINTALVSPWYHPRDLTPGQMRRIAAVPNREGRRWRETLLGR